MRRTGLNIMEGECGRVEDKYDKEGRDARRL